MNQSRSTYWHPIRLLVFFSLFSLLAFRTGDPAYLLFLLFLLYLVPIRTERTEGRPSGLLPFVNQAGRRVVRWHRLVLVWLFVLSAAMLGSCTAAYALTGDWRYGAFMGLAMGVAFSTVVTVQGFTRPVEQLPSIH
jgi:hypothetical protein